ASPAAAGRYDLLTVVMHELMHTIGYESIPDALAGNDLMAETLAPGVRRHPTPTHAAVDAAFTSTAASAQQPPAQDPVPAILTVLGRGRRPARLRHRGSRGPAKPR